MATQLRAFRIPVLFVLFGFLWAITSDPVITYLEQHFNSGIPDLFRGLNDVTFVLVTGALLYFQIKSEQKRTANFQLQYRTLFTVNPNPMWIYDVQTLRFLEVNNAAIVKYGYSRDEFLAMTIKDIRPETEFKKLEYAIKVGETVISDGVYWIHILKSGQQIIVSASSHRLNYNNVRCSMVLITDVTELIESKKKLEIAFNNEKLLNEELEENIRLLSKAAKESFKMREVMNKITNLVIMVSDKGLITWVNDAFTKFTGFTFNDTIGKKPQDLLFGPGTDLAFVQQMMDEISQQKSFSGEIFNYKKNGEPYWSQVNISPIFDDNGQIEFFLSVETVITERKEKEERLLNLYEKLKELAWSNSHIVRKPLSSVLGLTALLKQSDNEDEIREYVTRLEKCSIELDEVIKENQSKMAELENSNG